MPSEKSFKVGDRVRVKQVVATILSVTTGGAFVTLDLGIEGFQPLVHVDGLELYDSNAPSTDPRDSQIQRLQEENEGLRKAIYYAELSLNLEANHIKSRIVAGTITQKFPKDVIGILRSIVRTLIQDTGINAEAQIEKEVTEALKSTLTKED